MLPSSSIQREPTISSLSFDDNTPAGARRSRSRAPYGWAAAGVLALATAAAVYWWTRHAPSEAPPAPPPQAAPEAAPAPQAPPAPAIRHPIDEAKPTPAAGADTHELPSLANSDPTLRDALLALSGGGLERLLTPQDLVRRFVATVDNLPRKSVASQVMVTTPVPGAFVGAGSDETRLMGPENFGRYTPYVALAQAIDTDKLVALYVRFYPWFQQAYVDLGYPNGYFNDRLVDVIDMLLATPDVAGPIAVTQPRVLYEFADPKLEALPAGQKMMLRMGHDNAVKAKAKLRELRRLLTGAVAAR